MRWRFLSAVLSLWFGAASLSAAERPPNIVILLCDDLGWADLGCFGSTFYETPHLDRLASQGMMFTRGYAACPVCSPTRASLMTGQYPQRLGITDYIAPNGANQPAQWKKNTKHLPAAYKDRLALEARTIAEAARDAGYATFFAGKWHLGPEGFYPEDQGFQTNLGGIEQGGPYGGGKYFSPYGNPRLADGPPGEHLPIRLARETARFIDQHKHEPFLAYYAFYDVHTPLMAREDLRQKYEEKRRRRMLSDQFGREEPRDVRLTQAHVVYAAMVEAMDEAVGIVLDQLNASGVEGETIVLFTSDNGGLSTSEGWPTSNLPLRGGKGWVYEGGIRVPWIVRWPGVAKAGGTSTTPVCSVDVYPTLLAAMGRKPAEGQVLDGVDLSPLLRGETIAPRSLFWHYPHYGNQGGAPVAAVRNVEWKMIQSMETGRVELYEIEKDPSESRDVAASHIPVVAELTKELEAWQKAVGATYPVVNPGYKEDGPDGRAAARPK